MKIHIRRLFFLTAIYSGILLCTVSCLNDNLPEHDADGHIAFAVSNGNISVSRAAAGNETDDSAVSGHETIPLLVNGNTVGLSLAVEHSNDMTSEKPLTRGVPFDETSNKVERFNVTAIKEAGTVYFDGEPVSIDTDGIGLTSHYWPAGNLSFCAYSCSKDVAGFNPSFTKTNDDLSGSFSYALPTADGKNDAANQPDLVFAMTYDLARTTPVNLLFHHALSAIVFKVGRMPGGITLNSIAIANVYSSGQCDMHSDNSSGIDDVSFTWTHSGEQTGKYMQELDQQVVQGERFGTEEHTFMMLPQNVSDQTQLILTFTIGGRRYVLQHAFSGIVSSWEPDTKYIFTIGLPDEVDVEVEDLVEGVVKKNVTIQNTGISTGYIRAAIVGYWVDNSGGSTQGNVVAPWSESDGQFVYGSNWEAYWRKGDDGFYYHLIPVEHNGFTYPLFETYTLSSAAEAEHAGQKLELNIAAQIVIDDMLDEAWTIPAP